MKNDIGKARSEHEQKSGNTLEIFHIDRAPGLNGSMLNCGYLDGHVGTVQAGNFQIYLSSNMQIFYEGWRGIGNPMNP